MPTTEHDEHLAIARDPWRASLRASRERRAAAFRARRRRLRSRGGAAVLVASLSVLTGGAMAAPAGPQDTVLEGHSGVTVRAVQSALGISADGVYGPQTKAAVKRFQRSQGLSADGVAGPQTLLALGVQARGETVAVEASSDGDLPAVTSTDAALLARIARCESGGDPTALSPGGQYRGKYQFSRESWRAVGGSGDPAQAAEAEQDKRAALLLDRQGPGAWPTCSSG